MDIKINFRNVCLSYPVYRNNSSFRKEIVTNIGGKFFTGKTNNIEKVNSLNNISISIQKGDKIALVGPNGSGKTSLLSLIAQSYTPTSGFMEVNGKVTSMIAQGLGIDNESSGYENIFLIGLTYGYKMVQIKKKVQEIIEFSDLGNFIHMPIYTYSSGMKTRLNFAIITSFVPDILVIDEWISTGDKNFQIKAEKRLNSFLESNVTLIMATHSKELAKIYCNKFIHLNQGVIIKTGNIDLIDDFL